MRTDFESFGKFRFNLGMKYHEVWGYSGPIRIKIKLFLKI